MTHHSPCSHWCWTNNTLAAQSLSPKQNPAFPGYILTLPWQKIATPESARGKHTQGTTRATDYPRDTHTLPHHYNDVIMGAMASQITTLTIVCSTVYSGADERKHQSSTSLAFVLGIHRWPMNSPLKWPVTRKMFPFNDVITIPNCYKSVK